MFQHREAFQGTTDCDTSLLNSRFKVQKVLNTFCTLCTVTRLDSSIFCIFFSKSADDPYELQVPKRF